MKEPIVRENMLIAVVLSLLALFFGFATYNKGTDAIRDDVRVQQSQQRELNRINHAIKAYDATEKVGRCNFKSSRMYFEFNDPFTSITSDGLTVGTAANSRFKVKE
ncbi:MAG TPA: hypothetical protein VNH83_28330 [Bryobacteraceae bacterium]|nr:hypothetical protein [Bryobacteraceae bacterium]